MTSKELPEWCTPEQVAAHWNVKPATVRDMTRDGRLPRLPGIGADLETVRRILGHRDIATTLRYGRAMG